MDPLLSVIEIKDKDRNKNLHCNALAFALALLPHRKWQEEEYATYHSWARGHMAKK